MSATDHCNWTGVICCRELEVIGISCDYWNQIHKLYLYSSGLSGDFTMFGMQSLEELNLSFNNLSSTFIVAGESANVYKISLSRNLRSRLLLVVIFFQV